MIFCRCELKGETFAGIMRAGQIHRLKGSDSLIEAISGHWEEAPGGTVPVESVRLLAPLPDAPNIFCSAANYADHVRESGLKLPDKTRSNPRFFMKPRGTVRGTDDPVPIPSASPNSIDWECELALVIGRGGKNIPTEEAPAYIGGLLVFNDFSDRHFRPLADRDDGPWDPFFDWLHGKWHDGFSAMGPVVVTPDEFPEGISDLPVRLRVNGVVRQDSSTQQMIFNPSELIGFLSRLVTLQPGDIIATGTPGGVAAGLKCPFLKPGDIVEAEIAGIGVLRNRIVAEASL